MTEAGNFEGANIPVRATPDPPHRDELRARLYEARAQRVWPGLDDKRLTSWNALMVSALADAAAAFDDQRYRDAAVRCADFLVTTHARRRRPAAAHLQPRPARLRAVLEDHAFLLEALLALYEATFDPRWFAEARALADDIVERFSDRENGGFFSTAEDHEALITRRKEIEDNPIPAGQSAAALGLLQLAALTGEHRYEEAALGVIRLLHTIAPQHPQAFGHLLQAIDFHVSPAREVALVGPGPRAARAGGVRGLPPACRGGRRRGRRRAPARGPRAGRRPRRRLRVRALRLPAAGDRAGRACRAARADSPAHPVRTLGGWAGILTFPAGKRAKFVVFAVFLIVTGFVGAAYSGKFEDAQENETASFLPGKAESVKSLKRSRSTRAASSPRR